MMNGNILLAISLVKSRADEVESELETLDKDQKGCPNCGYLTQDDLDRDQALRVKIGELHELTEALDFLEKRM